MKLIFSSAIALWRPEIWRRLVYALPEEPWHCLLVIIAAAVVAACARQIDITRRALFPIAIFALGFGKYRHWLLRRWRRGLLWGTFFVV